MSSREVLYRCITRSLRVISTAECGNTDLYCELPNLAICTLFPFHNFKFVARARHTHTSALQRLFNIIDFLVFNCWSILVVDFFFSQHSIVYEFRCLIKGVSFVALLPESKKLRIYMGFYKRFHIIKLMQFRVFNLHVDRRTIQKRVSYTQIRWRNETTHLMLSSG